ncbi:glycosyltransferase [Rhodonellum sp.]|uniref:glycosyltransferase n=1 Tax=Rhodonellum sp. TaxID=2231180 RepID=UPI00271D535D|nr:glycosyltransferase [Rhodonellum sp.]MDO9553111.1 glycosyltransferase [Rhodonellum sp.]
MEKKISIILVTYNREKTLFEILKKIQSFNWEYLNFIIVNNASSDHTGEILEKFSNIFSIEIIHSKNNVGHGAGLALAFEYLLLQPIQPDYLIFLEDDSIPSQQLILSLFNQIKNSEFGMLAPMGSISRIGKRLIIKPKVNSILDVDFAVFDGAIMKFDLVKKVGLPEKDWFMMVDDYEYCYRIKRAGFKIGVIHNNFHEVLHMGAGKGFSSSNLWRGYYTERNYVFFVKKHFTFFNLADFTVFFLKRVFGSLAAPDRGQRVKLKIFGLRDGLLNNKGRTLDPKTIRFVS